MTGHHTVELPDEQWELVRTILKEDLQRAEHAAKYLRSTLAKCGNPAVRRDRTLKCEKHEERAALVRELMRDLEAPF